MLAPGFKKLISRLGSGNLETQLSSKLTKGAVEMIEGKNFAHLATLMKDGSPQATPVWIDLEGDFVLVNTAVGRVKHMNTKRDPRVAVSIVDQNNPYKMVAIRGRVVEQILEGADKHIDKLAKKYLGKDRYPWHNPHQKRIILKIIPDHVIVS